MDRNVNHIEEEIKDTLEAKKLLNDYFKKINDEYRENKNKPQEDIPWDTSNISINNEFWKDN